MINISKMTTQNLRTNMLIAGIRFWWMLLFLPTEYRNRNVLAHKYSILKITPLDHLVHMFHLRDFHATIFGKNLWFLPRV